MRPLSCVANCDYDPLSRITCTVQDRGGIGAASPPKQVTLGDPDNEILAVIDKSGFFHDLAVALDTWSQASADSLTSNKSDVLWVENKESCIRMRDAFEQAGIESSAVHAVLGEYLRGVLVSALSVIDGATAMAEKGRVHLVNEADESLGEGLHQEFVNYLFETGRLK